jgi:hypothetical protein
MGLSWPGYESKLWPFLHIDWDWWHLDLEVFPFSFFYRYDVGPFVLLVMPTGPLGPWCPSFFLELQFPHFHWRGIAFQTQLQYHLLIDCMWFTDFEMVHIKTARWEKWFTKEHGA